MSCANEEEPMLYDVYTALLNQTGTADPVPTELQNNLGVTIAWTRVGTGSFRATASASIFDAAKTALFTGATPTQGRFWQFVYVSATQLNLTQSDAFFVAYDDIANIPVEIRQYP